VEICNRDVVFARSYTSVKRAGQLMREVNRDVDEDVYVALREASAAAKRRLEDYEHRRRGDVKHHEPTGRQKVPDHAPSGSRSKP
jgi:hypothetical protein